MKEFYLVSTEHLEDGLWFLDESDFITGMNYVAIQAFLSGVSVVVFILMSNHLHFLIYGERKQVLAFINGLKSRYSQYYQKKYGGKNFLRRNKVDIRQVSSEKESLEWTAAYVQMNCVAANICLHPTQYPWGTGNLFFNPSRPSGKSLRDFSGKARNKLLHSHTEDLPLDWKVGEEGFILPDSYVSVNYVESLFQTPKRMEFFFRNSSKAKLRMEMAGENMAAFRDQVILSALPDMYRTLFQKQKFGELLTEEKVELFRQLRFRFSSNVNQIARVTGMTYEAVAKMMDGV